MNDNERISKLDELFFNLHPLKGFDRKLLFADDDFLELDRLILMFAMVWNDLKANLIFWEVTFLQKHKAADGLDAGNGQISGLQLTLIKSNLSIIHEFLELLKSRKNIYQTPFFSEVIRNLSVKNRDFWKLIVDAAEENYEKTDDLSKFLKKAMLIRNHIGFHFQNLKGLAKGYETFFVNNPDQDKAVLSTGFCMEHSRFYFADAAVQGALWSEMENAGGMSAFSKMNETFIRAINGCILEMIDKYLFQRKIVCTQI